MKTQEVYISDRSGIKLIDCKAGDLVEIDGEPALVTDYVEDTMVTIVILKTGALTTRHVGYAVYPIRGKLLYQPYNWIPSDDEYYNL